MLPCAPALLYSVVPPRVLALPRRKGTGSRRGEGSGCRGADDEAEQQPIAWTWTTTSSSCARGFATEVGVSLPEPRFGGGWGRTSAPSPIPPRRAVQGGMRRQLAPAVGDGRARGERGEVGDGGGGRGDRVGGRRKVGGG
jgi:hypothetical protein